MSDTEKLRAALSDLYDYLRQRHPPKMGGDHYPPSLRPLMAAANEALAKPERAAVRELTATAEAAGEYETCPACSGDGGFGRDEQTGGLAERCSKCGGFGRVDKLHAPEPDDMPMCTGCAGTGFRVQPEVSRELVQGALEAIGEERRGGVGKAVVLLREAIGQ